MTERPEDLLTQIFDFHINGVWLYRGGKDRRLATAEEKVMWAVLMHQAKRALDPETRRPMSHDHHESLKNYVEGALFQDGCVECERRAESLNLDHLDEAAWALARQRALRFHITGLAEVSQCERGVLRLIGKVLRLERTYLANLADETIKHGGHFKPYGSV